MATKKAYEMAAELADKLRARLASTIDVVSTFSAAGDPVIEVGDGSASQNQALVLTIVPISMPANYDVLGLAQPVYTPHIVQMIVESADNGAVEPGPNELGYCQWSLLLPCLVEALALAARVEIYAVTEDTTMDTVAAATATYTVSNNLKASAEFDVFHAGLSSQ